MHTVAVGKLGSEQVYVDLNRDQVQFRQLVAEMDSSGVTNLHGLNPVFDGPLVVSRDRLGDYGYFVDHDKGKALGEGVGALYHDQKMFSKGLEWDRESLTDIVELMKCGETIWDHPELGLTKLSMKAIEARRNLIK